MIRLFRQESLKRKRGTSMNIRLLVIVLVILLVMPAAAFAQPRGRGGYRGMPYGHTCPGMKWGPYGAPMPVKTADEARQAIERYYIGSGESMRTGHIEEERWYFRADVIDRTGSVVDTVIIDKRTGRIRSIY
jgi:hypothetical protein